MKVQKALCLLKFHRRVRDAGRIRPVQGVYRRKLEVNQ